MGGYFSTRWNGIPTRQDTGPLLKLDTAVLRRRGALTPGTVSDLAWTDGHGEPTGSIHLHTNTSGDAVTLIYRVRVHGGEWHDVRERVDLETTPCNYGATRPWFRCPACQSRRRVLYSVEGIFRCKTCHNLAYASTREDEQARSARRIAALHARLKAPKSDLFTIPTRPAHMKRSTYRRILAKLEQEQDRQAEYFHSAYRELRRDE